MVEREGNPYEGADDGGKNQQQCRVLLADVLLAPGVLGVGRGRGANVVDVVGVLQGNLHQVDYDENANERRRLNCVIQPVSAPSPITNRHKRNLSKGRYAAELYMAMRRIPYTTA